MKKWIDTIQEMRKDPKGKAILFFGFYLLFFIAVILFVRFSSRSQMLSEDYERGKTYVRQVQSIAGASYNYQYHITIDDQVYEFQGERYQKQEQFTYLNEKYYCNQENCFVKKENWVHAENPNVYHKLLEPSQLTTIIENAYLDSKTSYESGQMSYSYLITTDTLNQLLWGIQTDLEDSMNSITIRADENQVLTSLVFQLDAYCKYQKICQNHSKIEIDYEQVDEIHSIQNPLEEE